MNENIIEYLLSIKSNSPILRKLMSKDEIKIAEKLVKEGKLSKGLSEDKQKSICYYNPLNF